jgi:hypothetical protein
MEITVAGTAQDSHLIPFYALMEHQHITKSAAKLIINVRNAKLFPRISKILCTFATSINSK